MSFFVKPMRYIPVFSGKTEEDKKLVLYNRLGNETEFYIKHADGELQALSTGSKVEMDFDLNNAFLQLSVHSPEWTGKATGTRKDLIEEEAIR